VEGLEGFKNLQGLVLRLDKSCLKNNAMNGATPVMLPWNSKAGNIKIITQKLHDGKRKKLQPQ
jgi:hypothetical protein